MSLEQYSKSVDTMATEISIETYLDDYIEHIKDISSPNIQVNAQRLFDGTQKRFISYVLHKPSGISLEINLAYMDSTMVGNLYDFLLQCQSITNPAEIKEWLDKNLSLLVVIRDFISAKEKTN